MYMENDETYFEYHDEFGFYKYSNTEKIQPIVKDSLKLNSCERVSFINHTPYTILECEYKNLQRLKQDDLLSANDKGKYLIACIGLTQEERDLVLKHREFFEDTMQMPINQIAEKEKANLFMVEPRFEKIKFILDFDQNHSWNQNNNTQLDKQLCFDTIKKGIFAIHRLQTLEKMLFNISNEIKEYQRCKDILYPEAKQRIPKELVKKINEFSEWIQIDTKMASIIQNEAKNTQALENISKFYQMHAHQSRANTR